MARVNLIFTRLLKKDGDGTLCVGGVETYILRLSRLLLELGHEPVLYQQARQRFERQIDGLTVVGIPPEMATAAALHEAACRNDPAPDPVILFCAEQIACPSRSRRSILIQNGIYWDLPNRYWTRSKLQQWPLLGTLSKAYTSWCKLRDIHYARYRVCVDLNFVNWQRAVCDDPDESRMFYIPNCCCPMPEQEVRRKLDKNGANLQILFARRFFEYRGTRIFAWAAARIAAEFPNVRILICGEGPDETFLREELGRFPNIQIGKVPWTEMDDLLKETDIAVVPSLGSEGTSFSLCEAMGAACAVLASNVGGMTNMIIPEHNGLLMWPNAQDCHALLRELVVDPEKRKRLAEAAWRTACNSFSEERWSESWRRVLQECIGADGGNSLVREELLATDRHAV
jgi:glycosyltransferase involved in cell wall biosynthesis